MLFRSGNAKSSDIAINFGAPGDRRSDDGTMWVDYPSVGGKSPKRKIKTRPAEDKLKTFRVHSSLVANEDDWISGSGVVGIKEIELSVESQKPLKIVLYFCEPTASKSRSFRIDVNGKTVDPKFDVALAAGGRHRGVTRTFAVTPDSKKVRINFSGDREAIVSGLKVLGE